MSIMTPAPNNRLLLYNVPWSNYVRLLRMLGESQVRLTYDRGTLEIMTLTFGHENKAYLLGRFVDTLTEELGLPIAGGGSTTLKRRRRKRGLEPDACYWIAGEPLVRGKARLSLRSDPPPDLAIEVDVTHSSVDRMGIYAALGIPEVWRDDGQVLAFHVLGADGTYAITADSRAFPRVTAANLSGFLSLRGQMDANAIIRQFRAWARQHHGLGPFSPLTP
jgi:Uma2 family endonuclease